MNNVFASNFPPGFGPGREQNLFVGQSKHLYLLKDDRLKYQRKELDARTCGNKGLLTRFVILDVDTGTLYGEFHPASDQRDLPGFLARAWHTKALHPMRGLPTLLNVPQVIRTDERYWADLQMVAQRGGFTVGSLPGGFAAGVHAVKQFERSVESLFWRTTAERPADLWLIQASAGVLSAEASSGDSQRWKERWQDHPAAPESFFARFDELYEEPGAWRKGPFDLVLNGVPKEAAQN